MVVGQSLSSLCLRSPGGDVFGICIPSESFDVFDIGRGNSGICLLPTLSARRASSGSTHGAVGTSAAPSTEDAAASPFLVQHTECDRYFDSQGPGRSRPDDCPPE